MKTNQAWAWLAAGVLAAGLNASYYDGNFQWAHRVADRIGNNSQAALALASIGANHVVSEARILTARNQASSCPWTARMARVESRIARTQSDFAPLDVMSARQEAELARLEASRARIEAQVSRIRIPAAAFSPVLVRVSGASVCPRVRVNVPRMPAIKIAPIPTVHIDTGSAGPV
jgi:hypothetical protein